MHARCKKCGSRRTLTMHPDSYLRPPRCKRGSCKSREWRPDKYRMTRERGPNAPKPCTCPEYHFAHRRASGFCIYNTCVTLADRQDRHETGTQRKWV